MSSSIEDAGPNGGDGNGDGIKDSGQPNVTSLPSATGLGYLTLTVLPQPGCPAPLLSNVQATVNNAGAGDGFGYPFGLVQFTLNCAGPVDVQIFMHDSSALSMPLTTYRKFGHAQPGTTGPLTYYTLSAGPPNNVTFGRATVGAHQVRIVTFTLQDGVLGDDGPTGDGKIDDPGGAATAPTARISAAPALSGWGLGALVMCLGAIACLALVRRTSHTSC